MSKKLIAILLSVLFLLCLVSCGPSDEDKLYDELTAKNSSVPSESTAADAEEQMLVLKSLHGGGEDTIDGHLAKEFNKTHPGKTIVVEEIPGGYAYEGSTFAYETVLATELMSGEADYILDVFNLDPIKYAKSGLFCDLYERMEADPDFRKEDYYENLFEAMEYEGHLYTIPTSFGIQAVFLNKSITESLGASYEALDRINYKDILNLYEEAVSRGLIESSEPLMFQDGWPAGQMFLSTELKSYVDFEEQKTDFSSSGFMEYLEKTKEISSSAKMADGIQSVTNGGVLFAEALKNGATKSLFMDGNINLSPQKPFNLVQTSEEVVGPLMMTSIKGDVTAALDFSLMLPQSCKNQELAWEFIKFCIEEAQNPGRRPATAEEKAAADPQAVDICYDFMPVNKKNLRTYAELYGSFGDEPVDKWMPKLEEGIAAIRDFGFGTANLELLLYETLEQYYDYDTLTAEECAKEMDERAYIYMNE